MVLFWFGFFWLRKETTYFKAEIGYVQTTNFKAKIGYVQR